MKHPPRTPRYRIEAPRKEGRTLSWQTGAAVASVAISCAALVFSAVTYGLQQDLRNAERELAILQAQNLADQADAVFAAKIKEAQALLKRDRMEGRSETKIESRFDPRVAQAILFLTENDIKIEISADYVELHELPIGCAEMEIDANSIVIWNSNLERVRIRSSAKAVSISESRLSEVELIASGNLQEAVASTIQVRDSRVLASDLYSPLGDVQLEDVSSSNTNVVSEAGYIRLARYRGEGTIGFKSLENLPVGCHVSSRRDDLVAEDYIVCDRLIAPSTVQEAWPDVTVGECEMFGDEMRSWTNIDRSLLRSITRWNALMIELDERPSE